MFQQLSPTGWRISITNPILNPLEIHVYKGHRIVKDRMFQLKSSIKIET